MRRVAIVAANRSAFLKARTGYAKYSALELSSEFLKVFLGKHDWATNLVQEVFFSSVLLDPTYPNLARELVLRSYLPNTVGAHFVSNNCISGLVAVNSAVEAIRSGRLECALAGGVESMSRPALMLSQPARDFYLDLSLCRSAAEKLKQTLKFRPKFFFPVTPSPKEPSTGKTMGQHCELSAKEFGIARQAQDQYAFECHKKASAAVAAGYASEEILPIFGANSDNLVRKDTTVEKLSKLQPVFDRSERGSITAGNASALTDGVSLVCLMSEDLAREKGIEILGYLESTQFAAIDPNDGLLMAPALALPKLLQAIGKQPEEIDLFEIHEAFAAQVLCNLKLWNDGWSKYPGQGALGQLPADRVNRCGGSLAYGHPFAATGGRLIASVVNQLRRENKQRAVISVCAAGAMAAAVSVVRGDH